MKEYWLYLEPYAFIWSNEKYILLYNTLSKKGCLSNNSKSTQRLVSELEDQNNLYSVSISDDKLRESEIIDFINFIRFSFCGDLIDKSIYANKPLIIYPLLNINDDVYGDIDTASNNEILGQKIVNNLTDISVYLGGACSNNCKYCDSKYKQIGWCNQSESMLDFDKLCAFISTIQCAPAFDLKFYGGNLFGYLYWDKLLDELQKYSYNNVFYIDYRFLINQKNKMHQLIKLEYRLTVLIGDLHDRQILIDIIEDFGDAIKYVFSVESEDDFSLVSEFISNCGLKNTQILPYYNNCNLDFFETYIYQSEDDILLTDWSKKDICAHKVINANYFGKIVLYSDGNIYANMIGSPIGKIRDSVKDLIYSEIRYGSYWRKTRDEIEPCKDCLYKYLCPSPSNYELVVGKFNLCHVDMDKCIQK